MPTYTIWTLPEGTDLASLNITVSSGGQLDGVTQGDGTHLLGRTITLNNNNWQAVDIEDDDTGFADNDSSQQLTNQTTYEGITHSAGQVVEAEYRVWVIDPNSGIEYELFAFNIREAGQSPAYGTVEGLAFVDNGNGFPPIGVDLVVDRVSEGPNNSQGAYSGLSEPPCFASGTLIETVEGPRTVETLKVGDKVVCHGKDPQTVRWIGHSHFNAWALQANAGLRPIVIRKGAIKGTAPIKDLRVSGQHRILVDDWRAMVLYGEDRILVAAKHLVDGDKILVDEDTKSVSYFHILLEEHALVWSDGVLSESFQPGPHALGALSADALSSLMTYLEKNGDVVGALPSLKAWEGAVLR